MEWPAHLPIVGGGGVTKNVSYHAASEKRSSMWANFMPYNKIGNL